MEYWNVGMMRRMKVSNISRNIPLFHSSKRVIRDSRDGGNQVKD
jgi:hypothetical protein